MCMTSTFINPFTDFGFKKLFGEESSKPQLISFINAFMEYQKQPLIVELEFRNLEKLGLSKKDRDTIFDIYCTDEDGNHIIVELQRAEQTYFKDRMVYYSTFPIQEQGIKGSFYDGKALDRDKNPRKVTWDYNLKAVYSIGILDFEFKDKISDNYLHFVNLKDQDCNTFYKKLNYVFVEMSKFNKSENELDSYLDKWFYFLKNLDSFNVIPDVFKADKIIVAAFNKAYFVNMDKEEQNKYLASLKKYRDWYAVLDTAEQKGVEKGLKKAQKLINKAQKEKEKAQKEKEKAQKEKDKAQKEKEKALKREEKAQKEKEKAQKEKEKAQKEKEKAQKEKEKAQKEKDKAQKEKEKAQKRVYDLVKLLFSMNTPIDKISNTTGLSVKEIEDIIKG